MFTNLLSHADVYGVVDVHPLAIADETGLPIERVWETLRMLEAPDEQSRSPENEGRRIVKLDGHRAWGWQIVNYVKYRTIKNEDDRRAQNRAAQEKWRNKNKQPSAIVSSVSRDKPMQKKMQKEKESNTGESRAKALTLPIPDWINSEHWNAWHSSPKRKKASDAQKTVALGKLAGWRDQGLDYAGALENAAAGGYQGLFLPDKAHQNAFTRHDPSLTVPSRPGIDPALAKAIKDGLAASKPSAETLAKINQLRSQPA